MYDFIRGEIETLTPAVAVIEAGGVGYLLHISLNTYSALSGADTAKLYTHFIVREDAQILYGFFDRAEREMFRLLIGVSGVGGSIARMILSTFTTDDVCTMIATGQAETLKTVKGLGIKTAQKIIVELRDKIGSVSSGDMPTATAAAASADNGVFEESLSALKMLGFTRAASEKVVRQLMNENPGAPVENIIRQSLKKL